MSDIMQVEMKKQAQKWPMVKLGEVVDIKGGGTPSKDISEYWNGDIPWVSVKDFKSSLINSASDYITPLGLEKSATNLIPNGTIVVPTRMAVGKVAVLGTDMAINQDLKALIIKSENILDNRYLLRFLESRADHILKFAKGATVKGITLDVLKDLDVPLPPLEEQKRIAAILDKADAIRRKRQQAIQLADEFLRSVFLDMFGDPNNNRKNVPVLPMTEVFNIRTGSLNSNAAVDGGKYPFFTCAKEVLAIDGYSFDQEALLLAGNNAQADYDVKHYKGKFNAYQRTYVLSLRNESWSYPFYKFALEYQLENFKRVSRGSNTKYITMEIMRRTMLPVPDEFKQRVFVRYFDKIKNILTYAEAHNYECEILFSSLSKKSFSGQLQ